MSHPFDFACRLSRAILVWFGLAAAAASAGNVRIGPAPVDEMMSQDYRVQVEGQEVPVYIAKVAPVEPARRWKAMDDKANSAAYFTNASFASFDMGESATEGLSMGVTAPLTPAI